MGTLLVKLLAPQFQAILIDSTQTLQFQADITMQALMSPVVLRMAGSASLQINTQSYPPGRQPAQAMHGAPAGKGAAVVTADSLRQSIALKETLKTLLHCHAACILQRSQLQQITTVLIPSPSRVRTVVTRCTTSP